MPASRHHQHQHQQQQQQQQQVVTSAVKEKQRLCTNCKNHDLRKVWKKHKRYCKFRDCTCAKCTKTAATRKNCAEQTAKRRARQEDEQREQELQLNPSNFKDERAIPYNPAPSTATAAPPFRTPSILVVGGGGGGGTILRGGGSPMSIIKESPLQTSSDYDDTSSLDRGGGSSTNAVNDRDGASSGHTGGGGSVQCIDIDADSGPGIAIEHNMDQVKAMLKELIGRTKDFQNLNAFRLLALQHNTYDVDKATKSIKRAHEKLKFMDVMAEKPDVAAADDKPAAFPAHQARAAGRPPSTAIAGHHHHQHPQQLPQQPQQPQPQPPELLGSQMHVLGGGGGRTAVVAGGLVIDYRSDPATVPAAVMLEPAIVPGGRTVPARRSSQVNGTTIIGGPPHSRHTSVLQPRAMYPQLLPIANHATTLWHHPQPPFHASNMPFNPFFESDWSRHCRFPIFNPELQPEPVNLQHSNSSHHRRPEPSRVLDIAAERLQERAAHDRPRPVHPVHQDEREHGRHHA